MSVRSSSSLFLVPNFASCADSPLRRFSTVRLRSSNKVKSCSSDHYEIKATKYWNQFYKRHHYKFFKDRHYLEKEWSHYFSLASRDKYDPNPSKVVLEVGCGAGNTIFPLINAFPNLFVHACDFSTNAIALVKVHEDFREDRLNAFVCDVTSDDLCGNIDPSSVDIATLIFTLSAISPKKMALVLHNIKKVLKPGGYVLLRDYAIGDFAQEKLTDKNQMISDNFYFRGDGTCAFYFSEDFLSSLFKTHGFESKEINTYCKQIENRSRNIVMNRRWIRAVFCNLNVDKSQPTSLLEPICSYGDS